MMAYLYDTTFKHQKYRPSFDELDKVNIDPLEHRKIYADWIKKVGVFPHRHNPAVTTTQLKLKSRHKAICDYFPWNGGTCSWRFKELVEELEPGVHEFMAVTLFWQNGEKVDGDYFLFSSLQVLDSMIPEKSTIKYEKVKDRDYSMWEFSEPPARWHFTLEGKAIAGKHLWWEKKIGGRLRFCSDEFQQEFLGRDLKFLEFTAVDEA